VAVVEYSPKEQPAPPILDRAISHVEASGLAINVERTTNEFTLKSTGRPARRGREEVEPSLNHCLFSIA
jgi:hypothetical protein